MNEAICTTFTNERFISADLAPQLAGPDADLRADLVTALLTGIVVLRRLVGQAPLAEAPASLLLPHLQRILSALLSDKEGPHQLDK